MKASFDFDETLDNIHIQEFAKELVKMNIEVHVVTCNPFPSKYIFELTDKLKIDRKNVHYIYHTLNHKRIYYSLKHLYFEKHEDFIFHLDNDEQEVNEINKYTKVKGVLFDADWKENCLKLIK